MAGRYCPAMSGRKAFLLAAERILARAPEQSRAPDAEPNAWLNRPVERLRNPLIG
jgi:hypothetical protein